MPSTKKSDEFLLADAAKRFENMNVEQLRKEAQAKSITGRKMMRKTQLVKALAQADVDELHALDTAKKTTKRTAKRCEICGERPIDRKTAGRDSSMCTECFDYAGWENTHTDNSHAAYTAGEYVPETTERAVDLIDEIKECPVCQDSDPADKPAKQNGSKPGRKVAKQPTRKAGQTKGQRFAEDAKAAGWKAKIEVNGFSEIVTVRHPNTAEWITLTWHDGVYQYGPSLHKNERGNKCKVRNVSEARRLLCDPR